MLDAAQRQLQPAGKFVGFLIASPVVIGTLLLGFVVAAWGVFDHVRPDERPVVLTARRVRSLAALCEAHDLEQEVRVLESWLEETPCARRR